MKEVSSFHTHCNYCLYLEAYIASCPLRSTNNIFFLQFHVLLCFNFQSQNLLIPYSLRQSMFFVIILCRSLQIFFHSLSFTLMLTTAEERSTKLFGNEIVEEILCETLHGRTTSGVYCILHCCRSRS